MRFKDLCDNSKPHDMWGFLCFRNLTSEGSDHIAGDARAVICITKEDASFFQRETDLDLTSMWIMTDTVLDEI